MGARRWPFIWDACCQAPPATNPGGSPGNETGGFEAAAPPLFGLAPGGVYRAVLVTKNAVRSYRTLSPLPPPPSPVAKGGLLSVALSLGSPPPDVIRHRISMEPGLSSPPADTLALAKRPSGLLTSVIRGSGAVTSSGGDHSSQARSASPAISRNCLWVAPPAACTAMPCMMVAT